MSNYIDTKEWLDAISNDNLKEVKRLINKGIDINSVDYDKRSALHIAGTKGLFEMTKFLLELKNINVNAVDAFHHTPLQDSIKWGESNIILLFYKKI